MKARPLTIKLLGTNLVAFGVGSALSAWIFVAGTGIVIAKLLSWLTVIARNVRGFHSGHPRCWRSRRQLH